jgi:hypothetical protein
LILSRYRQESMNKRGVKTCLKARCTKIYLFAGMMLEMVRAKKIKH